MSSEQAKPITTVPMVMAQMAGAAPAGPPLVRPDESCAFVIFGASGDLTGRKLVPALYNLFCQDLLPPEFAVVGFAFTNMTDEQFRATMRDHVHDSSEVLAFRQRLWDEFAPCLHYITASFDSPAGYDALRERLKTVDATHGTAGNRLFYLATSPHFFGPIVDHLQSQSLADGAEGGWTRIVIEKPFGHDLASARTLNARLQSVFQEDQIYRIDHYLGKETVQNLLAFRFANSILEPVWNRHYVDHVQITASETLGVEHRGGYYDRAGALRDMFQNHLLQLLALVAMEPPVRYEGNVVRDRKGDVLRAVTPLDPAAVGSVAIRGQYGPGHGMPGYREEEDVSPHSYTETYAAMKLMVDNWRWAGTPFYLRSGKRMAKKLTQIAIEFKRVPHMFFNAGPEDRIEPNVLTIRIQPDEGISLTLGAKPPGPEMHVQQMQMNFSYASAFGEFPATAYETLLLDVMQGDLTLFNRSDTAELSWELLAPVLEHWAEPPAADPFPNYAAGTWGPDAADELLARDGRRWRNSREH